MSKTLFVQFIANHARKQKIAALTLNHALRGASIGVDTFSDETEIAKRGLRKILKYRYEAEKCPGL